MASMEPLGEREDRNVLRDNNRIAAQGYQQGYPPQPMYNQGYPPQQPNPGMYGQGYPPQQPQAQPPMHGHGHRHTGSYAQLPGFHAQQQQFQAPPMSSIQNVQMPQQPMNTTWPPQGQQMPPQQMNGGVQGQNGQQQGEECSL